MGRPRIFINTSIYPDEIIETLARMFYDEIVKDISAEEKEETLTSSESPKESGDSDTLNIAN